MWLAATILDNTVIEYMLFEGRDYISLCLYSPASPFSPPGHLARYCLSQKTFDKYLLIQVLAVLFLSRCSREIHLISGLSFISLSNAQCTPVLFQAEKV